MIPFDRSISFGAQRLLGRLATASLVSWLALGPASGCARPAAPATSPSTPTAGARPEVASSRGFGLALFTRDALPAAAVAGLRERLHQLAPSAQLVGRGARPDTAFAVGVDLVPAKEVTPPKAEELETTPWLDPADAAWLPRAGGTAVIWMKVPAAEKGHAGLRAMQRAVLETATTLHAAIYDPISREWFSPAAFRARRVDGWSGDVPIVPDQVVIHQYRENDLDRLVTLGMGTLGLPDLAIDDVPSSYARSLANLINVVAQQLAQGATPAKDGRFRASLSAVAIPSERVRYEDQKIGQGKGALELQLVATPPKPGDDENELLTLSFDLSTGKGLHERQQSAIDEFWGSADAIVTADHDAELLAASERARKKLLAMAPAWSKGRPERTQLLVKGPFRSNDGRGEWMWIEVVSWEHDRVRGVLMNDPFYATHLRSGQAVSVMLKDAFDYMLKRADGSTEGGETSTILDRRQRTGK